MGKNEALYPGEKSEKNSIFSIILLKASTKISELNQHFCVNMIQISSDLKEL